MHVVGGGHGQRTAAAAAGRPVDGAHPRVAEALHPAELPQVEEQGELSGHGPQRQEGGQDLGQQEGEVQGVDGSLQGQDEDSLVGHEEQQHRQLEHERQQAEGRQLWHLMTGRRGGGMVYTCRPEYLKQPLPPLRRPGDKSRMGCWLE